MMEFVFDKQGKQLPRCTRQYEELKEMIEEPFRSLKGDVTPGDDKRILPLQAADLIAWQFRNSTINPPNYVTRTYRKLIDAKLLKWHNADPTYLQKLMDVYLDWYVGRPVTLIRGEISNEEKRLI